MYVHMYTCNVLDKPISLPSDTRYSVLYLAWSETYVSLVEIRVLSKLTVRLGLGLHLSQFCPPTCSARPRLLLHTESSPIASPKASHCIHAHGTIRTCAGRGRPGSGTASPALDYTCSRVIDRLAKHCRLLKSWPSKAAPLSTSLLLLPLVSLEYL